MSLTPHLIFIYCFLLSRFFPEVVWQGLHPWSHSLARRQRQHIHPMMPGGQGDAEGAEIYWHSVNYLDGLLQDEEGRFPGSHLMIFRQHFLVIMCLALAFLFLMFGLLGFLRKMQFLSIMGLRYELPPSEQQAATWALPPDPRAQLWDVQALRSPP